jgi:hypothetical protein
MAMVRGGGGVHPMLPALGANGMQQGLGSGMLGHNGGSDMNVRDVATSAVCVCVPQPHTPTAWCRSTRLAPCVSLSFSVSTVTPYACVLLWTCTACARGSLRGAAGLLPRDT